MEEIKKVTGHENIVITSRGNEAIKLALGNIKDLTDKKVLLIPDQGGWLSYKKIPLDLGFEIRELKTDKGVVVLDELINSLEGVGCFLFTGFAGYYAEQPIGDILRICKEKNVFVVNDVSGCFGDKDLCKGDFLVCSFGKWKVVDYGKYGFVSSLLEKVCIEKSVKVDDDKALKEKIKRASERLKKLLKLAAKVKVDLKDFNVFHDDLQGVNVIVEYDEKILDYCKEKGYEYVICPKYHKVNEKAISIELKRLEL